VNILPQCDVKEVYDMIKKIRNTIDGSFDNPKRLTDKISYRLKSIDKRLHTHSLRCIYAVYMWMFVDKQETTQTGYITSILHHEYLEGATHYNHIIIYE